uniref:Peptidase A2 domain-containing protein n=1 Tax=Ciona savignyi TaxID=51511 RepID=H2Z3J4_CIOSA
FDRRNKLNFLIDTGSEISIVPVRDNANSLFRSTKSKLVTLNDTEIECFGHVNCGVFHWRFKIANVRLPILGVDFLEHNGCVIDLCNRRVK